jgi:hypothetical protein
MENKNSILISVIAGLITFILIFTFLEFNDDVKSVNTDKHICKEDSLQLVINELQHTLETEEDGWDSKEKRYEDVIFEYEYGLNHLKEYQPNAYKEFHRIIGFKERFSVESERENKKRLNDFN